MIINNCYTYNGYLYGMKGDFMNRYVTGINSEGLRKTNIASKNFINVLLGNDDNSERRNVAKSIGNIALTLLSAIGFIFSPYFILDSICIIVLSYMLVYEVRPSLKVIIGCHKRELLDKYGIDTFSNQIDVKERDDIRNYKSAVKEIERLTDLLNEPIIIDDNKVSRIYRHLNVMESDIHMLIFNLDENDFSFVNPDIKEPSVSINDYELEAINYLAEDITKIDVTKVINIIELLKRENERLEMENTIRRKREAYQKFTTYDENETPDIEKSLQDCSERLNAESIKQEIQVEQAWLDNLAVLTNATRKQEGE